jgi:3-methylcrotonyl-CoA carboxylase beta subunit
MMNTARGAPGFIRSATRSTYRLNIKRHSPVSIRRIATYDAPYQAAKISILQSAADTSSSAFSQNARNMDDLVQKLSSLHEEVSLGGTEKAREKHTARGKMLVREYVFPPDEAVVFCNCILM